MANNTDSTGTTSYQGNDRLLIGMVLGVLGFWMFSQTTLNVAPAMSNTLGIKVQSMNIAVSITSLFSGIFVVVFGGLADHYGRLKLTKIGFILSIIGSLMIALTPSNSPYFSLPILLGGRILQGLSAASIMPATLALLNVFWHGPARQRAISIWSIGSWGGGSICAFFGGFMQDTLGWRSIFFIGAICSVIGLLLMKGTPESKVTSESDFKLDYKGIISFMIVMLGLQILVTQGEVLGWTSPIALILALITVVCFILFFYFENHANGEPFFDFKLFKNSTFTGAVISNFMLNGIAGILIVSLQVLQFAGKLTENHAGILTLGYPIMLIVCIRVGEKLLQHFGTRFPMLLGCFFSGLAILLLMGTPLSLHYYTILVVIAYTFLGIGLGIYATPSTDAALSNLPKEQSGAGAGIYKMASSLGAAFGVAISAAVFTAIRLEGGMYIPWVKFGGGQDNIYIRQAGIIALGFDLCLVVIAIAVILWAIPKQSKTPH